MYSEFPPTATALVIGGSGGLGSALVEQLNRTGKFHQVLNLGRHNKQEDHPCIDYSDESTLLNATTWVKQRCELAPLTTVIIATGALTTPAGTPEKSWAQLDSDYLREIMLINAIGPALAIKHFAPLLPKDGFTTWVMISAKVGSIGDNALGGWYGYRASKAALNQIMKTAAIEMTRRNKQAICVALHPGTVDTKLSNPFNKVGLNVRSPEIAATEIISVIENLSPPDTGSFIDYTGNKLPW
jgi:NAD(P)-dependent dehydrogenase (short-subunit alcohol dehydrogenase family)